MCVAGAAQPARPAALPARTLLRRDHRFERGPHNLHGLQSSLHECCCGETTGAGLNGAGVGWSTGMRERERGGRELRAGAQRQNEMRAGAQRQRELRAGAQRQSEMRAGAQRQSEMRASAQRQSEMRAGAQRQRELRAGAQRQRDSG
eukprot:366543-Chlamydomonas_euryale.AAC.7